MQVIHPHVNTPKSLDFAKLLEAANTTFLFRACSPGTVSWVPQRHARHSQVRGGKEASRKLTCSWQEADRGIFRACSPGTVSWVPQRHARHSQVRGVGGS